MCMCALICWRYICTLVRFSCALWAPLRACVLLILIKTVDDDARSGALRTGWLNELEIFFIYPGVQSFNEREFIENLGLVYSGCL